MSISFRSFPFSRARLSVILFSRQKEKCDLISQEKENGTSHRANSLSQQLGCSFSTLKNKEK